MLKRVGVILLVLCGISARAQEEYGMSFSNYTPASTMLHNPTNIVDSKVFLDVHLFGLDAFLYNNYMYLDGGEFSYTRSLILQTSNIPPFRYNTGGKNKAGYINLDMQFFGGTFQYKQHGFGLETRQRNFFDFRKVPSELAQIIEGGGINGSEFYGLNLSGTNTKLMHTSYFEVGASYANAFYHFNHDLMIIGGTAKYLMGISGAGLKVDNLEYTLYDPYTVDFFDFKGGFAYAQPAFMSGKGFAVDLGFTMKKTLHNVTYYWPYSKASSCDPYDTKWELGVALLDLGYLNFNKDARNVTIESQAYNVVNASGEYNFQTLNDLTQNELATVNEKDKFIMLTPFALNLQLDYNFENYFWLSGSYIHGFWTQNAYAIKRPNVFNIAGRYERKWFEATIPVGLYNLEDVRVGLMLRFGYLTIGTDKLGAALSLTDVYGTDLYFHLRWMMFNKPGCKRKHKKGRRNATDCVKT